MSTWVPLHQHSQYSILDASASIEGIVNKAKSFGMQACALTDHGNLFGAVDFYKACNSAKIKPLIGCEVYVAPKSRFDKKKEGKNKVAHHLVLLVKNEQGYRNLCKIVSQGYLEGFYYFPRIDKQLLKEHHEGLICLSGCMSSELSFSILNQLDVESTVQWYLDLFGDDYYLELQRHPMVTQKVQSLEESWLVHDYEDYIAKQNKINETLIKLSSKWKIDLVATNDTHYLEEDDWQAHEVLLNVQSGEPIVHITDQGVIPNPKRRIYPSREFYFKSPQQIEQLFQDVPQAVTNTLKVAEKCHFEMDFKTKHYPVYTSEKMQTGAFEYLKQLCEDAIDQRYSEQALVHVQAKYPNQDPKEVIQNRLNYELSVIQSKELSDYLLIVWDFIHWAKTQHIPVGPGRGSGAGSVVLYLIGVTDIEPLRFNLFFERFINPERVAYPDIDVDICMSRRSEVIEYTVSKYGAASVAQIITFGTMKAKMSVKDVGRVLSVPLSKVNALAKLLGDDLGLTLDSALENNQDLIALYNQDEQVRQIIDLACRLEGSIRNTGIHAAGIIVSAKPLMEQIPVCVSKDADMMVTQYAMKQVESVGMLKIDFLGLKTLTSIQLCVDTILKHENKQIDWVHLPLEDKETFKLLQKGGTLGVFQMESSGMKELSKQLKPDKFEEIIAIGALYRPGPMDMIPSFIARKHGLEAIEYDHPEMEKSLAETYGIMVYQEQVMQIAQQLAGYSLGQGDVLRKAMGKKDAHQMQKEREKFKKGAVQNKIEESLAAAIFDKIEKFASYGFNKSHAAAYGYLTYTTAYLKANYPKHWMACLMTCDRDDLSKVSKFIREAQAMHIPILPPDVNESANVFTATQEGIRFALSAIKGVGQAVVEAIVEEREKKGKYLHLEDFIQRVDHRKVGKKTIEYLVEAGSFDFTNWTRDQLKASVESMYDTADKEKKEKAAGVMSLFSLVEEAKTSTPPPELEVKTPKDQMLAKEKELLGFFLTGHPLEEYAETIYKIGCLDLSKVETLSEPSIIRAAFLIEAIQIKVASKSQKKFAIARISNQDEFYDLMIWSDVYEQVKEILEENKALCGLIHIDEKEGIQRWTLKWCQELSTMDPKSIEVCDHMYDRLRFQLDQGFRYAKKQKEEKEQEVIIEVDWDLAKLSDVLKLKEILLQSPGTVTADIRFVDTQGNQEVIKLDEGIKVDVTKVQKALEKNAIFTLK